MTALSAFLLEPARDTKWATAFNYAYQTEQHMYAYFERPENALRLKQVGRAMTAGRAGEGSDDLTSERGASLLCSPRAPQPPC